MRIPCVCVCFEYEKGARTVGQEGGTVQGRGLPPLDLLYFAPSLVLPNSLAPVCSACFVSRVCRYWFNSNPGQAVVMGELQITYMRSLAVYVVLTLIVGAGLACSLCHQNTTIPASRLFVRV